MMKENNVVQKDTEYVLTFPFSGIKKEDISLQIEKGVLFLSAKRNIEVDASFQPIQEEFPLSKKIHFSYNLGEHVDPNKIDAKMEKGILTITLGKREESLPKKISIA